MIEQMVVLFVLMSFLGIAGFNFKGSWSYSK